MSRLRFNVIVENPPMICEETPEHNVSFTISLPRRVSLDESEAATAKHQVSFL